MVRYFSVKKVSKKMYAGTYNFKDDADGAFPDGWTDADDTDCETTVIAVLDGHRKVVQFDDGNAGGNAEMSITITQSANQTIELWIGKDSIGADTTFYLMLYEGATRIGYIVLLVDDVKYYDGAEKDIKLNCLTASELVHIKIILDDTANTYDVYLNGVLEGDDCAYENNSTTSVDKIRIVTGTADTGFKGYIDAIGLSSDTDYNIGDNVHYRHFKEVMGGAGFEGQDVGDTDTTITWIGSVSDTGVATIVSEFNEHKKVCKVVLISAADDSINCGMTITKNGWVELWAKVSDITGTTVPIWMRDNAAADLIILVGINSSQFQKYTGGAWSQVTGSPIPVNDTWYHFYIQWYDDDTFDIWIDNVLYESGTACENGMTNGIDRYRAYVYAAGDDLYIDAVNFSTTTGSARADNRTFDYHDPYTKTDITSDVIDVVNYENKIYGWRKATLVSKEEYEFTNEFFQIYDVNSKLVMEGEIKNRIQDGPLRRYPLRDKNYDDLMERITHTFTTDKIHDPTDSTSMLKTALPNLDHTDGDLLLADADTEASTYSPVLKNYPTYMFLRDISDLGDTVTIVKPKGVVLLDDDLASGDTLDIDTEVHKDLFVKPPHIVDILEVINYFEIFGTINPDTGERFYKVIDNSGTDKKRKWRYVNNEFRNQTDVDAYAAALDIRITTVKIISFEIQDLGAHNMGETLNLKYVSEPYNIPQANYYIIKEEYKSMNTNSAIITLSEGLIEESKYSATFEKPQDYVDSYESQIYNVAFTTVYPQMSAATGATRNAINDHYIDINAIGERCVTNFYVAEKFDSSRAIIVWFLWERDDAGGGVCPITWCCVRDPDDGGAPQTINEWTDDDLPARTQARTGAYKITAINPTNVNAGDILEVVLMADDTWGAQEIIIKSIGVQYYIKRLPT